MMFGKKTIGIILNPDQNLFDVFAQLTRYLESKDFEDPFMELGGGLHRRPWVGRTNLLS